MTDCVPLKGKVGYVSKNLSLQSYPSAIICKKVVEFDNLVSAVQGLILKLRKTCIETANYNDTDILWNSDIQTLYDELICNLLEQLPDLEKEIRDVAFEDVVDG